MISTTEAGPPHDHGPTQLALDLVVGQRADPSLAEGLQAPEPVFIDDIESLGGDYARQPVENERHQVTATVSGADITWSNAAGVSWGLEVLDGQRYTGVDCPYGALVLGVSLEEDVVIELNFGGEVYARQ